MSVSLKSFVVEGKLAQEGVSTGGGGETKYRVTGSLNANLPEGLKAKLTVTDRTVQSVRAEGESAGQSARWRAREARIGLLQSLAHLAGSRPARAAHQQRVAAAGGRRPGDQEGRCGARARRRRGARAWHLG